MKRAEKKIKIFNCWCGSKSFFVRVDWKADVNEDSVLRCKQGSIDRIFCSKCQKEFPKNSFKKIIFE